MLEQKECPYCKTVFTPRRRNQNKCGKNLCNVLHYQRREKVRALLMQLHTPEQLIAVELLAETMVDNGR